MFTNLELNIIGVLEFVLKWVKAFTMYYTESEFKYEVLSQHSYEKSKMKIMKRL